MSIRRAVQSAFLDAGLTLEKEALSAFVAFVEERGAEQQLIFSLLDAAVTECASSTKLTREQAQAVISALLGTSRHTEPVQVISAFDVPRVQYNPIRKIFYQQPARASLHGTAEDKVQMHLERMYLLLQRLKRNRNFSRPAFAGLKAGTRPYVELTELKALLGCVGEVRFVCGCISQLQDGRYFLEDLSEALPIDLACAARTSGFFLENCIVVAEGALQHNGVFKVAALGFPPPETRAESQVALKGLDLFGGTAPSVDEAIEAAATLAQDEDDRIVFLADLWLDRPATLDRLRAVLEGFEGLERVPSMFVLMGNFQSFACSSASTNYAGIRDNFGGLASLLASFPRIMEGSRLVFVPGMGDAGPAAVLPRPPLPESLIGELRERLPNAVFASNPCRIRHYSQEIVVFRDDLQKRMRKLCLLKPNDEGVASANSPEAMFEHLCATLLQQSHLCPVPMEAQPVYWGYDHALWLYPMPDALVLADPAPAAAVAFPPLPNEQRPAACACLNPGSFGSGTFAAYAPATKEVELCDVPQMED